MFPEGMATQNPPQPKHQAFEGPVDTQGVNHIAGTARLEAACSPHEGRKHYLIGSHTQNEKTRNNTHAVHSPTSLDTAQRISAITSAHDLSFMRARPMKIHSTPDGTASVLANRR